MDEYLFETPLACHVADLMVQKSKIQLETDADWLRGPAHASWIKYILEALLSVAILQFSRVVKALPKFVQFFC